MWIHQPIYPFFIPIILRQSTFLIDIRLTASMDLKIQILIRTFVTLYMCDLLFREAFW
jgi:hypothetical protein